MTYTWNRKREGYAGSTAAIAIRRVFKEERKNFMAKKRSCRRSTNENVIHEKAVKMRKMTDEQLVYYVEDRVEKARSEGFNKGKGKTVSTIKVNILEIVEEIGSVKGIGTSKLPAIKSILERRLVGDDGA